MCCVLDTVPQRGSTLYPLPTSPGHPLHLPCTPSPPPLDPLFLFPLLLNQMFFLGGGWLYCVLLVPTSMGWVGLWAGGEGRPLLSDLWSARPCPAPPHQRAGALPCLPPKSSGPNLQPLYCSPEERLGAVGGWMCQPPPTPQHPSRMFWSTRPAARNGGPKQRLCGP